MAAVYDNGEVLGNVLEELFKELLDGEKQAEFKQLGVTVKFKTENPDCVVFIDPQQDDVVQLGKDDDADITFKMQADFMHDFWQGKTDIIKSIGDGKINMEMSKDLVSAKLIDLLPLMVKGLEVYPQLYEKYAG